jgi:hypothetical protein
MNSYGFNLRSFSSLSKRGEDRLLLGRHFLLASGVEKLQPARPFPEPIVEEGDTKGREEGGTLEPAVVLPERGGDWTQAGVLPPLSGSVLIRMSSNPFGKLAE